MCAQCKDVYELRVEDRALRSVFSVKSQARPAVKEVGVGIVSGEKDSAPRTTEL